MYKKLFAAVALTVAVVGAIIYFWDRYDPYLNKPVAQFVADKGLPSFVLKTFEINKGDLKILRLLILPKDPETVTNWNSITNAFLMWIHSEDGKFTARYYFEKMRNKKGFDGTDWYSTRSLFRGERVTFVMTDSTGHSLGKRTSWVDALSMYLEDVTPRKVGVHEFPNGVQSKE